VPARSGALLRQAFLVVPHQKTREDNKPILVACTEPTINRKGGDKIIIAVIREDLYKSGKQLKDDHRVPYSEAVVNAAHPV
jgi:hypothetical protein